MGIKPTFTAADVQRMVQAKLENANKAIVASLARVGNKFVIDARTKADFTDRTGNLRSSIGFILLKDGNEIKSDFEKSARGTDKATGEAQARGLAQSIAGQYKNGYALIVVAGMEYAAAVESKGKDVLTGSSFQAIQNLNKYFKQK